MALMNVTIHGCWFRHNRWPRCQPGLQEESDPGWGSLQAGGNSLHPHGCRHLGRVAHCCGGAGEEAWVCSGAEDKQLEVRHLFQRLSLLLQKGNSALLVNRTPEDDAPWCHSGWHRVNLYFCNIFQCFIHHWNIRYEEISYCLKHCCTCNILLLGADLWVHHVTKVLPFHFLNIWIIGQKRWNLLLLTTRSSSKIFRVGYE